jgi:signal transduction histidine kinase
VKIVDNGTGMKDTPEPSHIGGMGIAVMRSRAASVGGFLDVMGTPGTGFTVEIVVPLPIEET